MKKCPFCGKMNMNKAEICIDCQCEISRVSPGIFILAMPKHKKANKDDVVFTVIKEINLYKERLEPTWECSDPDDQWLFAETVTEHVGTKYDILYVYADHTYKEARGLSQIPADALSKARTNLDYDAAKCCYKKRWFWHK